MLPDYLSKLGVPFHIENQDTYSIVKRVIPEGKTTCSLCSRLRRGILYRVADELGATKIALGHHRDDILETFFLNMFFGGKLKGMPPKLQSDDGKHIVIRPLAYVKEADHGALRRSQAIPDHPVRPVRQPGEPASASRSRRCCASGRRNSPGRVENMFTALSTRGAVASDGPRVVPVRRPACHAARPIRTAISPSMKSRVRPIR